ncbi:hypothetical protein OAS39_08295 [Pirellulales bacterium]|nr:hypothetical protein [Pirellulales bacterium]
MPSNARNRSTLQGLANAISITTYEALEDFIAAFSAGHINLLIVIGEHGLAKGTTVRRMLGSDVCWIEGNATAFGMYLKLFQRMDELVVIDDVDSLHSNRNAVRLLKCLCQTEPEKTVAWPTAARELKQEGVPREFVTRSRVVILSNDWQTPNANVAAVQDRGHTLVFQPTAEEVHRKTAEWFDDQEIFDWFEERLHLILTPSMRLYYRARELKRSGLNWQALVPLAPENHRKKLAMELLRDPTFETQEARAREFTRRGGGCRATYFNYARQLRANLGSTAEIRSAPAPS